MDKVGLIKLAIGFVTSASVGSVVSNVSAHVTPANVGTVGRVLNAVGTIIISAVVSDKCAEYIEHQIFKEETK